MVVSTGCRPEPAPVVGPTPEAVQAFNQRLMRCAPLNLAGQAATTTSLEELRSLLGKRFDDAPVRELTKRLGGSAFSSVPAFINLHEHGLTLVVGADTRIEAIDLHGRTSTVQRFQGTLPFGLDFYDRSPEVEARLGKPLGCTAEGRCLYIEQGVEVRYGPDACVSSMTLRPEVARGAVVPRHVHVRRDSVHGIRGIVVQFSFASNLDVAGQLIVRLKDENGVVPGVIATRPDLQREGKFALIADVPAGPNVDGLSAFVPFYALNLSVGNHQLAPSIEVEPKPASPVLLSSEQAASIAVTQPACRWLQLGVQSLTVKSESYGDGEGALDLRWVLEQDGRVVFSSSESPSGFRARWNEMTPALRVCDEDTLSLNIQDVDLVFHDDVAWKTLTSSELVEGNASSLAFGKVEKLQLRVKSAKPPMR
jgi:hypothetical protein